MKVIMQLLNLKNLNIKKINILVVILGSYVCLTIKSYLVHINKSIFLDNIIKFNQVLLSVNLFMFVKIRLENKSLTNSLKYIKLKSF